MAKNSKATGDDDDPSSSEHKSPVAIRRLRSGRKMKTPSSSASKRKRLGDEMDDISEDDNSQTVVPSHDSNESTMRSTKVRRRLFNPLEMVNEEGDEKVEGRVTVVGTDMNEGMVTKNKSSKKTKRKHDETLEEKDKEVEEPRTITSTTSTTSTRKKKKVVESQVHLIHEHQKDVSSDLPTITEMNNISHSRNSIPTTTTTEHASPNRIGMTRVPIQSPLPNQATRNHDVAVDAPRSPVLTTRDSFTDSEVERLQLHSPTTKDVEIEQEEREEGRRDGLVHRYFGVVTSDADGGKTMTKLVLLLFLLHLSIVLFLFLTGDEIPITTILLLPFCTFSDMNTMTKMTWTTYQRWGLLKTPGNVLSTSVGKGILQENPMNTTLSIDNVELETRQLDLQTKVEEKKKAFEMEMNELKQMVEIFRLAMEHAEGSPQIESRLKEISDQQLLLRQKLLAYKERLDSIKEELKRLENSDLRESKQIDAESLRKVDSFGLFNKSLNIYNFDNIQIPGENCTLESFQWLESASDEFATLDDVDAKLNEYLVAVSNIYNYMDDDGEDDEDEVDYISSPQVEEWIDGVVLNYTTKFDMNRSINLNNIKIPRKMNTSEVMNVLTERKLKEMLSERLEIDRADRTGKYDYASLRSGANVIHSGSHRTSVSLVESLPLVNQLLSKLSLRFYGHGPYAALEPTYPDDAFGQCWSFTKENETLKVAPKLPLEEEDAIHGDEARGTFATLTVQLADSIFIESVVIEHPYALTPSNRDTAIRNFRVLGFQDKLAAGQAWNLGDFEFNSESRDYAQEFAIRSQSEDGQSIPPLSSVMLAIDSNWGAEYSCLYRFRVQGKYADS